MTAEFDLSDVRQSWSFTLPMSIPSANELKRAAWKGNRGFYKRVRADFGWLIKAKAQWVPKATGKRKVTITRLMGKSAKKMDQDNLVAGAKGLIDELVDAKLLTGDDENCVSVEYRQERAKEHGTQVTLEDV